MNNEMTEALDWSTWLDFEIDNIANIAESEGVYKNTCRYEDLIYRE